MDAVPPQSPTFGTPAPTLGLPPEGEMRRIDPRRSLRNSLLRATLLLSSLCLAPLTLPAQQAAAESASASPSIADIRAHVTPEDMGDSLLFHRHYQQAIDQYRKAQSDSPDVWNKMGIAYQMLSDLKDAERCYKESLRLKPVNELALNNLGTVYELLGSYAKAETLYRKALQLDPDYAQFAMNLGTNLMIQAKYNRGAAMYKRALALDPHVFEQSVSPAIESGVPIEQRGAIHYYLARNCAQAGFNDRAVAYLKKALDEGFVTPDQVARDITFAALRALPAFQQLLAEQQNQ